MPGLGFHLTFRATDSRVLAPSVAEQRRLAQLVHRVGEPFGLLAFRAAGDHLHVEAVAERTEAGRLAQALASGLTQVLEVPGFQAAHLTSLADQRHLRNTFLYVLRNTEKHGSCGDPGHEGSSIGALLGLHEGPAGFRTRVRQHLPRLTREELLGCLGLTALEPEFDLDLLADAAAGAMGLVALDRSFAAATARGAAVRVATGRAPDDLVAAALDISLRTLRRLRTGSPTPIVERAIGLRMGLARALRPTEQLEAAWLPGT